jgi:hypothetical protein
MYGINEWSLRRKRIIFALISSLVIIFLGIPSFLLFYKAPTCFDGKQNGDETGADCGGSCTLLCQSESLPLLLRGDPRVIQVGPGIYNIVALVDNPNINAETKRARYILKVYEANNFEPIRIIAGEVYIAKASSFVIFEGPIDFGLKKPIRATLEWDRESLVWQKQTQPENELVVKNQQLIREATSPRVDAFLVNNSLERVDNVELSVVVSEEGGNIMAASKTFVEEVPGGGLVPIVFTWPAAFEIKEYECGYPVDVALVIDRSGSMADISRDPPQPLTDVKNAALSFLSRLGKNDKHALISFANTATLDAPFGSGAEAVRSAVAAISIQTDGLQNTNIGAGILAARDELGSSRHRQEAGKALVLLTDGVPTLPARAGDRNYPSVYAEEAAELARQDGISIYTIGLGNDINKDLLRRMATTTSEAYFAPSTEELRGIYNQIATKICKKNPIAIDIYIRVLPDRSYMR